MMYDGGFRVTEMLEGDGFVDVTALCRPAVYALVRKGEVIYIGKSVRPIARVYNHSTGYLRYTTKGAKKIRGIIFDEVWLLPCNPFQLDAVEQRMIGKYLPRFNVKGKPKPVPIDLAEIMQTLLPTMPQLPATTEPRNYIRRRL